MLPSSVFPQGGYESGSHYKAYFKSDGSTTADEGFDKDAACVHRRKNVKACDKPGRDEEE